MALYDADHHADAAADAEREDNPPRLGLMEAHEARVEKIRDEIDSHNTAALSEFAVDLLENPELMSVPELVVMVKAIHYPTKDSTQAAKNLINRLIAKHAVMRADRWVRQ